MARQVIDSETTRKQDPLFGRFLNVERDQAFDEPNALNDWSN